MGRKREVTDEMIVAAGKRLRDEYQGTGKEVTPGAIRAYLGDRGSHQLIARAWEAFMAREDGHAAPASAAPFDLLDLLPDDVREPIDEAFEGLKRLIVDHHLSAEARLRKTFEIQVAAKEQELQRQAAATATMRRERDDLQVEVRGLTEELRRRNEELARLRQEMLDQDREMGKLTAQARDATIALGAANEARDRAVLERNAAAEEARVARAEAAGLNERAIAAEAEARALRAAAGIPAGDGAAPPAPRAKRSGNRGRAAAE